MVGTAIVMMFVALQGKPIDRASAAPVAPPRSQTETLKDWALARCIARGASGPFAHDAAISAAALLERGDYGIETYTAIDALVGQQLKKRYGGSISGDYVTLKCLDLARGKELGRLVRRQKATPVR